MYGNDQPPSIYPKIERSLWKKKKGLHYPYHLTLVAELVNHDIALAWMKPSHQF